MFAHGGAMKLQVGRALDFLIRGMERDPQAAMAGVLVLAYGVTVGQVVRLRWGDLSTATRYWHLGGDELPLTAPVLEVLADYAERTGAPGGAPMFADGNGKALRVADLTARIDDLSGNWYPVDTLRDWAHYTCGELLMGHTFRRILDHYAELGATPDQVKRLSVELAARRRAGIEEYHGCLAWCADAATQSNEGAHDEKI